MRILIAGGLGFMGSYIAERFAKEGDEIYIVDRLGETRGNVTAKHIFYELDTADKRCEEIFRLYNIDVVIYAGHRADGTFDCRGIVNFLSLAACYEVKKFVFLSSAVPDEKQIAARTIAEECCRLYQKTTALDVVVARLAHVYGPRRSKGVIAALLSDILQRREIADNSQGYDFLYVEDAVDAVFRIVRRDYQGDCMNISSNTEHTLRDVCGILGEAVSLCKTGEKEKLPAKVDNARALAELGWESKYTLAMGLQKTYEWHKAQAAAENQTPSGKKADERLKWRPYAENILMFGVMAAAMLMNDGSMVGSVGIDYNFIYIAAMGLLYGKGQALPAVFLSSALLMTSFILHGADFVAVLYQVQHMVHFASYLFLGVLTGYITDNKDRAYHDLEVDLENVKGRYQFLEKAYLKSVEIKERLYKQIVNSDDSIGRTYKIVKKLDAIELENLFTAATEVAAEMMGARSVAIYVMNKNRNYLRLKTRLGMQGDAIANSIKVQDFAYLQALAEDKQVFVNKLLIPGLPDMAAPVVYNGEVIAVIQVYRLKFEDLSLNKQNLLKITSLLIAGALAKAYQYEASMQDKKYLPDTRILLAEEFEKICLEIRHRQENNENEEFSILLKIVSKSRDYAKINDILSPLIRDEDFLGVRADGCVYLLLLNITANMAAKVQQRIESAGLASEVIDNGING